MLAESNSISKEIGLLFKSGNKDEIPKLKQRSSEIKKSTKVLSDDLSTVKNEIIDILSQIPNIPHESVPAGNSKSDNVVIFESKIKINNNMVKYNEKPTQELLDLENEISKIAINEGYISE